MKFSLETANSVQKCIVPKQIVVINKSCVKQGGKGHGVSAGREGRSGHDVRPAVNAAEKWSNADKASGFVYHLF